MKNTHFWCSVIAVSLLSIINFVSCQQDELVDKPGSSEEQGNNPSVSTDGVVIFTTDTIVVPKTHWTGSTIVWSKDDKISMGYSLNGGWSDCMFDSKALTSATPKARFAVPTDLKSEASGSLRFYGIYPSSAVKSDFSAAPVVTVEVPSCQTVTGITYDRNADVMISESFYEYDTVPQESVPLIWNRVVAHADVTLTGLDLQKGESLLSVALVSDSDMCGVYELDLTSGEWKAVNSTNELILNVSSLPMGADGNLNLWAVVMPCTMKSFRFEVTTSSRILIGEVPSCDITFVANARNAIKVDMSSAQVFNNYFVQTDVFDLLDLDYPGLENVKAAYEKGRYAVAADALVEYFRNRTSVINPEVDLSSVVMYNEEKRLAEQALEHRFCVRRGHWYESVSGSAYTYWDFDDAQGNINWDFQVEEAGQEFYQKHWHAWFKFLAMAQVVTGDDKYFDSWKEVYSDWLETYPCPGPTGNRNAYGNRSWHQLSVATRISTQLDYFQYFITSGHFTGDWMATFLIEFHKAVEFCRANPYEEESSNIRFAQQTAEAKAAMLFPEFRNASKWLADVAPQISSQFSLQFYSDGVHTEMAPNYQLGVMDNFRAIYQTAKVNGKLDSFDPEYTEKMRKACLFLANYVWPDYTWEWFNDTFQQTKNVLLNNIKRYSVMFPEENLLKYLASERREGTVPEESLITFPVGGYYILRTGWDGKESMLILKNNFNPDNEWHCHMDNGTFALFHAGRDFLPDPGVYTYGGNAELDALRTEHLATASHNTLTKNLQSIAKNYSKGECLLSRSSASEDLVVTQNASYSDLTHRRAVYMLDRKFYVIVDEAFGSAAGVDVNLSFHMCQGDVKTDADASLRAYGVHTEFTDGNDMLLRTFSETAAGYTPETGTSRCSIKQNESFDRTYYRVTVDKKTSSDVSRFITVIYPARSASISASFNSAFAQKSSSATVTVDGKTYNLSYTLP